MKERTRPQPPLIIFVITAILLALLYLPLLVMAVNSMMEKLDHSWVLTLRWYREVFADTELLLGLERSFLVGLSASLTATLLGTGAALAILKGRFFGLGKTLEALSFISLIIPELVFALSLLMWFFLLKIPLGLTTVVAAHVTFCLSFVMLTVAAGASALDLSLDDAGRDLGASEWQLLTKITLPLLVPAMVASFLLSFLLSFDDFLITFYTNGAGTDTLPLKLYGAIKIGITPKLSALSTLMFIITIVPMLILFKRRALKNLL